MNKPRIDEINSKTFNLSFNLLFSFFFFLFSLPIQFILFFAAEQASKEIELNFILIYLFWEEMKFISIHFCWVMGYSPSFLSSLPFHYSFSLQQTTLMKEKERFH